MSTNSDQLAVLRMMLQQQQAPQMSYTPTNDIADSLRQGVGNIAQLVQQRRQQQMLQDYIQQQQLDQQKAQAAKLQALKPLADKVGLPVETLAQMDASTINNLLTSNEKAGGMLKKAQLLQEQFGQAPPQLGSPDFSNLDVNGYNMGDSTANLLAQDDQAYQAIARASANQQLRQLYGNQMDLTTPEGQNIYQQTFGASPAATPNSIAQQNATLKGTLLGNLKTGIENVYLPDEKELGISREVTEQRVLPYQLQATLDSTLAGTDSTRSGKLGKDLENAAEIRKQKLQLQIVKIATDDTIPVDKKAALISTLAEDPSEILGNLKTLSTKGFLGKNAKDFTAIYDTIQRETEAVNNPKPVAKPAPPKRKLTGAQQAGSVAKTALNAVPYASTPSFDIPSLIMGYAQNPKQQQLVKQAAPFVNPVTLPFALGGALIDKYGKGFMQGFSGKLPPAPTPQPQRPVTRQGMQQAQTQALNNANTLDQTIQGKQQLVQQGNNAVTGAQNLLDTIGKKQQEREQQLRKVFVGF